MTVTCARCGREDDEDAATLTWSTSRDHGRLERYCDACSRQHLRALEAKLDQEHW